MVTKHDTIERLYNSALKANQILTDENKRLVLKIRQLEQLVQDLEYKKVKE